jgi:hypothetical protein
LHSNLANEEITVYKKNADFDKQAWADETATALAGGPSKVLARNRFITSLEPWQQQTLLARTHQMMKRVAPRWVSVLRGQDPGLVDAPKIWDVDDSEDISSSEDEEATKQAGSEGQVDFAKQNKKNRRDSKSHGEAERTPSEMFIGLECMMPQVKLMRSIMWLASQDFENEQRYKHAMGLPSTSRMRVMSSGSLTAEHSSAVWALVDSEWEDLEVSEKTQRNANLIFGMASRAQCGADQLIDDPAKRMPKLLWTMLDGPEQAKRVRKLPGCRLDSFSEAFLLEIESGRMTEEEAKVRLWQQEQLLRTETLLLECRNASLTRYTRKSQTWLPTFVEASDAFLLRCQRKDEADAQVDGTTGDANVNGQTQKKQRKKRKDAKNPDKKKGGGGGMQRGFLASFFRGRSIAKEDGARKQLFDDGNEAYKVFQRDGGDNARAVLKEEATAATRSYSADGVAFGRPKKRRRVDGSKNAPAVCTDLVVSASGGGSADALGEDLALVVAGSTYRTEQEELKEYKQGRRLLRENKQAIQAKLAEVRKDTDNKDLLKELGIPDLCKDEATKSLSSNT